MHESWHKLESLETLQDLFHSLAAPFILFKHSTRCEISRMALHRVERDWNALEVKPAFYYLDLLQHRDISAAIAEMSGIQHESPQLLFIKSGKPVFHASHYDIRLQSLVPFLS